MPSEELPGRRLTQVLHAGFADPTAGPRRRLDQADLVDSWLAALWQGAGAPASGAALAAIGSLGRRDLGPGSDLDLVLLVDTEAVDPAEAARLASALWYPIWDSGTSLDHAMRSPLECEQVAREDLRAAISLLDLRLVAGDEHLVDDAAHRVRSQWRRGARRRIGELVELAHDRDDRYGPLAHSTEPNLKSDRGGLRDVTVIRAIAESWLADHDHTVVDGAAAVLLDARDALQAVTGRSGTRLGRARRELGAAPHHPGRGGRGRPRRRRHPRCRRGPPARDHAPGARRARAVRRGVRGPARDRSAAGSLGRRPRGGHRPPARGRDAGPPRAGACRPAHRRPARRVRRRPRGGARGHRLRGARREGHLRALGAGLDRGPQPPPALRRAPLHRGPPPDRDGPGGAAIPPAGRPPRPAAGDRAPARPRQARRSRRPRPATWASTRPTPASSSPSCANT